jgi:outer membrane protein assembly factor BamB
MRTTLAAVACALLCGWTTAEDWPQFRGPGGRGVSSEKNVPTRWGRDQNIKWSVKLPTRGNGSPIVSGGRIFIASASRDGRERSLICFDRRDGKQLWSRAVEFDQVEATHETNPYGAVTPATDGQRVVVWHGSAGVYCYDVNGELVWSRDLGKFHHIWGYASSPVIHDGKVYQLCGPGERQFLIALSLDTGEVLWEVQEPGGSASDKGAYIGSWATPVIVDLAGRVQVVCGLPTRVIACDPNSGEILWYVTGVGGERHHLMYTTPIFGAERGVALGGFGGPALGFTLGGSGDMTGKHRLWHDFGKPKNPQRIGSGIVIGDVFYIANADNEGSIECRDVATGQPRWEVKRTNDGPHWGSLLLADGNLYSPGQKGVTRVFAANPDQYEEVSVNDLGEQTHATPAISDGELFIRTWEALYCIANPQ